MKQTTDTPAKGQTWCSNTGLQETSATIYVQGPSAKKNKRVLEE
jgi:hypothetical protein